MGNFRGKRLNFACRPCGFLMKFKTAKATGTELRVSFFGRTSTGRDFFRRRFTSVAIFPCRSGPFRRDLDQSGQLDLTCSRLCPSFALFSISNRGIIHILPLFNFSSSKLQASPGAPVFSTPSRLTLLEIPCLFLHDVQHFEQKIPRQVSCELQSTSATLSIWTTDQAGRIRAG